MSAVSVYKRVKLTDHLAVEVALEREVHVGPVQFARHGCHAHAERDPAVVELGSDDGAYAALRVSLGQAGGRTNR